MTERGTLSAVRYLVKRAGYARKLDMIEGNLLGRMFGFIWVFAFFWSVPLCKYPKLHKQLMTREMDVRMATVQV